MLRYINVYEVTRHYGGPEEGGWWYDAGDPLASVPVQVDDLYEVTDAMRAEGERIRGIFVDAVEWGDIHSVNGGAEVCIQYEDRHAEAYPSRRPHYE